MHRGPMKKDDLYRIATQLAEGMHSESIVNYFDKVNLHNAETAPAAKEFGNRILAWIVDGVKTFQGMKPDGVRLTSRLALDRFYGDDYPKLLQFWTDLQVQKNNGDQCREICRRPDAIRFAEAHRMLLGFIRALELLHPQHDEGDLTVEGISDDHDPTIEHVENVISAIRNLVIAYAMAQGVEEVPVIRVTQLDMGSNYQVSVKVDGKGEIGSNLKTFLMEVCRMLINPMSYIRTLNAEAVGKEVEAVAMIQARVTRGEITAEAGQLLVQRLFDGAKKLTDLKVYPADLVQSRNEANPVAQLMALMESRPEAANLLEAAKNLQLMDTPKKGEGSVGQ